MNIEERLRQKIREQINFALNEISTTANVAGYLTPYAFAGDGGSNTKRVKSMAKMIGYTLTKRGKEDAENVDKLNENYYDFKRDDTKSPYEKIASAVREATRQVKLAEKQIRMCSKYKNESKIPTEELWKPTRNEIMKLEARLTNFIGKLREMRG
jgi:hypothetical protein